MKPTKGDRVFDAINYFLLVVLCFACIYPILHVVFSSFSNPVQLAAHSGLMFRPLGFSTHGYRIVFGDNSILVGYRNTIVYAVVGVAISMALTIAGAYTLSRRNMYWKKPLMIMITITMFFGGGLIPWFLVVTNLGMFNNIWAMVLPPAISTWNLIVMRSAFQALPIELEEAATIDGASEWYVLSRIIIPLSKPVLAVIFLFYFVGSWNSWFNAMVLLRDRSLFPLQLLLREILHMNDPTAIAVGGQMVEGALGQGETTIAYMLLVRHAVIVVATLPILCIYPFLQKYFVQGMYVGSLKG